MITRKM